MFPRPGEATTEGGIIGFLAPNFSIPTKVTKKKHEAMSIAGFPQENKNVPPSVVPRMKDVIAKKKATIPHQSKFHKLIGDLRSRILIEMGSCK
jgi:hypothetical protein